jgi:hypothetical protein
MDGGKKFRSTVLVVKNALRFLIKSESKNFEFIYQKRKVIHVEKKSNSMKHLNSGIPDEPTNVRLMVTGSDNITVTFDEPLRSNGAMVIKYKSNYLFL